MPPGTYMTYWAWKFCVPDGDWAEKLCKEATGKMGPAELALPWNGVNGLPGDMDMNSFTFCKAEIRAQIKRCVSLQ